MTRARETINEFTERAIRATDAGKLIPPIVYLPTHLRGRNLRLTVDHVKLTMDPPTVAENHVRIAQADPVGFLIAVMHGQPIPAFHIENDNSVTVKYEVADFDRREKIAMYLAGKVTMRGRDMSDKKASDPDNWDEIVRRREPVGPIGRPSKKEIT